MRKTALCLIFILMLAGAVRAQNIFTALHLNDDIEYRGRNPKKIVETNIFFTSKGKKVNKSWKIFDSAGMLLSEERFDDDGNVEARLNYVNDTVHKIILSRVFERWTAIGISRETAYYQYDQDFFLTGITEKDKMGNLFQVTRMECNKNGHPVELMLFDGNGNLYGKEIATYLYDRNQVVSTVISGDGRKLSTDTMKISFKNANKFQLENEVYNESGDLLSSTNFNYNGSQRIYEYEYEYDSYGNCLEERIYKIIVQSNGKRKRERDRIFKKVFSY
jgi:hypothetical protein